MGVSPLSIPCLPLALPRLVGSWLWVLLVAVGCAGPMIFRALIELRAVWLSP